MSTNEDGNSAFVFKPAGKVGVGQNITATATGFSDLGTSEFSAPKKVERQR